MINNEKRNVIMELGTHRLLRLWTKLNCCSEVMFVIGLFIRFHKQNCMFCSPDVNCLLGSVQASSFCLDNWKCNEYGSDLKARSANCALFEIVKCAC